MPMGEVFLSAFLQVLFDRIASEKLIDFARRWKVDAELKELELMLSEIQDVLDDAEEKQIKNKAVRRWLDELRDLAYDAEDVLDEFATEAVRWKLELESQTYTNKVRGIIPSLRGFIFNFEIVSKITKITEQLDKIAKRRERLGLRKGDGGSLTVVTHRIETSSLVSEPYLYGRETDMEKLTGLLLLDEPSHNEVCVIPIVGMGGAGKTTLAQHLYNDERVKNHFNLKAWACVSDDFDVKRITVAILESITKRSYDLKSLEPLQSSLENELSGKKFLLVLDDVWSEKYNDWNQLRSPFRAGAQGSKILVTTRNKNVASMMRPVTVHDLGLLSNYDCWLLFARHAFGNKNSDAHPNLVAIGKKIVKKCGGLPLAAKTLGGLLHSKQKDDEWERILNSEIWDLRVEDGGILPALRLSYYYLPPHLKRCFGYCSIFPKDYLFREEELVVLWMAEGFVQPRGEEERMEAIGSDYFHDLLERSFFQHYSGNKAVFVMHNLINDLARSVSGNTCFREEDSTACPKTARHSSLLRAQDYDRITRFEPFYEVVCLRTFLPLDSVFVGKSIYIPNEVPHNLISKLVCLRVLSLSKYVIAELPDSIGKLKHLRYLDLTDSTMLKRLPESMSNLYNLQTLLLINCYQLIELFEDMGNLINLRILDITGCSELQKMPLRIGRLTSLQILTTFVVGQNSGSGIEELWEMLHLRSRKLHISNLNNVVNVGNVMLRNKQHLRMLELSWKSYSNINVNDSRDERVEEEVLDQIQPHTNLEILHIKSYGGTRFPSWIGHPSFSNMVRLKLDGCRKCEFLPPLGQLRSLKVLEINRMDGVKIVGREFYGNGSDKQFPSLEILRFGNMLEWVEWSGGEQEGQEFTRLLELKISMCPKLRRFSHRFPSLEMLHTYNCQELAALPGCPSVENSDLEEGEEFPSLEELYVRNSPELAGLPRMPMLHKLTLNNCDALVRQVFPQGSSTFGKLLMDDCGELATLFNGIGFQHFSCLRRVDISARGIPGSSNEDLILRIQYPNPCGQALQIWACPLLVSLLNEDVWVPTRLEYLLIRDCQNLVNLPQGLHNMPLISLEIEECHYLTSFPRGWLPTTLKRLWIHDCKNLESLLDGLNNLTSMEILEIVKCPRLVTIPEGGLPSTLNNLVIEDCLNVKSLLMCLCSPTCLNHLIIEDCPSLDSFPEVVIPTTTTLRNVDIFGCESLESLPNWMHNLTSLQKLVLRNCPGLVSFPEGKLPINLEYLQIKNCKNLKPLFEWGMHRLTSLRTLQIGGYPDLVSFPEWLQLPATITHLLVEDMQNLESLPKGLHNLTSLEELEISSCPILKQRCTKIGVDWYKIAHIPYIHIDGQYIL